MPDTHGRFNPTDAAQQHPLISIQGRFDRGGSFLPTIFTHTVVGLASAGAIGKRSLPIRFWVFSVLCSIIPDADVIAFKFGISYGHFFGHRGFFHSLVFAGILGTFIAILFFRKHGNPVFYTLYFSILIGIHDVLDAFTSGGLGIALFSPFSPRRIFFPWRPIPAAPINPERFFTGRAWEILWAEFLWVWIPVLVIAVVLRVLLNRSRNKS